MQYDADTPEKYLTMLDEDWRKDHLVAIRAMMRALPGATEGIAYKMLRYDLNGEVFAHLNAQKAYVGVYLGDLEQIDPGAAIRGGMNCGKSCLRVTKRDDLSVVKRLIEAKAALRAPRDL